MAALVATPEGSLLTYFRSVAFSADRTPFHLNSKEGLANTARRTISALTNLKNHQLYFDPLTNSFELLLNSGGKRFYNASKNIYLLTYEILPSGNKLLYEYDEECRLSMIKEINATEKTLGWIKIQYDRESVHAEASDGKTVDYRFWEGDPLLSEVIRSDKPSLRYQYQIESDGRALLKKKELPEDRFVDIEYYSDEENKNKVKAITVPESTTQFSYGQNYIYTKSLKSNEVG